MSERTSESFRGLSVYRVLTSETGEMTHSQEAGMNLGSAPLHRLCLGSCRGKKREKMGSDHQERGLKQVPSDGYAPLSWKKQNKSAHVKRVSETV